MQIDEIFWKEQFIEKLEVKHGVYTEEVEEIIFGKAHIRRVKKVESKAKIYIRHTDKLLADDI